MTGKKKILHLVAAVRPNFMKVAPLYHALKDHPSFAPVLIHTGQHYDASMSEHLFRDLDLPPPAINFNVGSGSHAEQTGAVMVAYEAFARTQPPAAVIVPGDVNSTVAVAIAAKKSGIPVIHLEAGLRAYDDTMPEEINRRITDTISDVLWTPSPDADKNLKKEGVAAARITRVGNIMIDSLMTALPKLDTEAECDTLGITRGIDYAVVTTHRPLNTDSRPRMVAQLDILHRLGETLTVVLPLHPRIRKSIEQYGLLSRLLSVPRLILTEPLPYSQFMALVKGARAVITDSGGVQEETTYLNIPCLTVRPNTERPITVTHGTNELVTLDSLLPAVERILAGHFKQARKIPRWDGKTAARCVADLEHRFCATGC